MGYDEEQWGRPRWQWIVQARQQIYDETYHKIASMGWRTDAAEWTLLENTCVAETFLAPTSGRPRVLESVEHCLRERSKSNVLVAPRLHAAREDAAVGRHVAVDLCPLQQQPQTEPGGGKQASERATVPRPLRATP